MGLCYEFEKHMTITFAIVATVLIIGLFSQVVNGLDITVDFNGRDEVISIPNGCVDYSDNFLDHAEVTVKKSWTWGGDTVECEWRPFVDYFLERNYIVTLDGITGVFMRGPPLDRGIVDENNDSNNNSAFESTSNITTFEEYEKKYCPEYSDPDEHKLLVLCPPHELEESDDVPDLPED